MGWVGLPACTSPSSGRGPSFTLGCPPFLHPHLVPGVLTPAPGMGCVWDSDLAEWSRGLSRPQRWEDHLPPHCPVQPIGQDHPPLTATCSPLALSHGRESW